jgi:predicted DNA-binding transcriptional regulator
VNRDQLVGSGLLALSIVVIVVYGWLIFFPPRVNWDLYLLKITGFVAVLGVFGILGWIGYTLATTPPPKPIEEIEKELEEELKKLEEELKEEEKKEGKGEESVSEASKETSSQ